MKRLGWLAFLAGCGFQGMSSNNAIDAGTQIADASIPDGSGSADASPPPDAPPPDAQQCFGVGLLKLCLARAPIGDLTLSTPINTDTAGTCTQVYPQTGSPSNAPELCAIAARTITVQGTVTVQGSRALVLIAADTITIPQGATLDASSTTSPARLGPGANLGACSRPGTPDGNAGGGGGGAGGSLATKGGDGGLGNRNAQKPLNPSKGGTAGGMQPAPTLLRGGCPGGKGGDGKTAGNGGAGGNGGGAVYLIAGTSITVDGDVFASGTGGGAAADATGVEQGGGGGGTGGMIGFDAATVTLNGRVAANGGAGGGGGGLTTGGGTGGDGTTTNWNARATAGAAGTGGTGTIATGAPGTAINMTDKVDGPLADGGGGGGGGGLGVVTVYGRLMGNSTISPGATTH